MEDAEAWVERVVGNADEWADLVEERDLVFDRLHEREDALWELREESMVGEPSPWDLYRADLRRLGWLCLSMSKLDPIFDNAGES